VTERLSIRWAKTSAQVFRWRAAGRRGSGRNGRRRSRRGRCRAGGQARPRCGRSRSFQLSPPGGRDVAGVVPEGADEGRVFRLDLGEGAGSHWPKWISRRAGSWGRRGRGPSASAVATARERSEEMTGACGRWAFSRARAAVSDRSAGRSVQPTMVFAWVGRGGRARSGSFCFLGGAPLPLPSRGGAGAGDVARCSRQLAFQDQRQARDDGDDQPGLGGKALIQAALASRNWRASALSGTMPQPTSLVTMTTGAAQVARAVIRPVSRSRSWSASRWLVSHRVAQSMRTTRRRWQRQVRRAGRAALRPWSSRRPGPAVPGDAVAHLVIPGFGGGDVAAGAGGCGHQALGEGGFPRSGAADDKS
jgi:hypothetical protein